MRNHKWQAAVAAVLLMLSAGLYYLHYALFRDATTLFTYLILGLAFLPLEIFLVSVFLDKLIRARETRERRQKLNMIIGVFFSQLGNALLAAFSENDPEMDGIRKDLVIPHGAHDGPGEVRRRLTGREFGVDIRRIGLEGLRDRLIREREFLVRLMENPTLFEHESFTDLLWAVLHLTEELTLRKDLKGLPEPDLNHLRTDIKRAYTALVHEWISYMEHLKINYPYLFSLAIRTNPFDRGASAVVR